MAATACARDGTIETTLATAVMQEIRVLRNVIIENVVRLHTKAIYAPERWAREGLDVIEC